MTTWTCIATRTAVAALATLPGSLCAEHKATLGSLPLDSRTTFAPISAILALSSVAPAVYQRKRAYGSSFDQEVD
jgi:hypothetical protein